MGFLVHIFQFHSIRTSLFDNRNAEETGFYWLSKVFAVVDGFQCGTVLFGRVWIDETYFPRWKTKSMGLASEIHTTPETKGLPDSENPMDQINRVHRYLSGFIGAHRGFLRDELQD